MLRAISIVVRVLQRYLEIHSWHHANRSPMELVQFSQRHLNGLKLVDQPYVEAIFASTH